MQRTISNTPKDWCLLREEFEEIIKNTKPEALIINVKVSTDPASIESDVTRLQNFFLLADIVLQAGFEKPTLNVLIDSEETNDVYVQTLHYLSIQCKFNTNVTLNINNKPMNEVQTRFGRITPIMKANSDSNSHFSYQKIMETCNNSNVYKALKSFLQSYITSFLFTDIKASDDYTCILSKDSPLRPFISLEFWEEINKLKSRSDEEKKTLKLSLEKLFFIDKDNNLRTIFYKMALSNIVYVSTNLTGTKNKQMSAPNKVQLIDSLFSYIEKYCLELPVLSMYMWSVFLRYMMKPGMLLSYNEKGSDNDKFTLAENILIKIKFYALSYADGLYQLIENSCIHSLHNSVYFSLRLYHTDTTVTPRQLVHVSQTLSRLLETYNDVPDFESAKMYFEISLMDNTISYDRENNEITKQHMISHYNSSHPNKKVNNLLQLFNLPLDDINFHNDADLERVIIHYGLRTFERIVLLNGGYFVVSSGEENAPYHSYRKNKKYIQELLTIAKKDDQPDNEKKYYDYNIYGTTTYKILFPINLNISFEPQKSQSSFENMFDLSSIAKNYIPQIVKFEISDLDTKNAAKFKTVKKLFKKIESQVSNTEERIICIPVTDLKHYEIELLAKTIVYFSFNFRKQENRFALLFYNKDDIYEFVRIYASFFDKNGRRKENTENNDDDDVVDKLNTQIALCSMRDELPEVNFILSGDNLSMAHQSARMYAYYNSDSSLEYMTALDSLVRYVPNDDKNPKNKKQTRSKEEQHPAPLFPFDLFLDLKVFDEDYDNTKTFLDEDNIWFYRRVEHVLKTQLQEKSYGCKINNIHIGIGSKIHLNTFYTAELLFHNYGNICRFAYLIARTILKEEQNSGDKILLVSYEEYSNLLIQQVANILQQLTDQKKVPTLIFSSATDEHDDEENGGLWPDFIEMLHKPDFTNSYKTYIVLPIATTLTTIFKIQNIMDRLYHQEKGTPYTNFGESLALIVVGNLTAPTTEAKYWKNIFNASRTIEIQHDINRWEKVKYFFNAPGKWHKTSDDDIFTSDTCLINVDKTQTLPDAIFELWGNPKKIFSLKDENSGRVQKLRGHINYSHISDMDNHHQYHIEYRNYFEENKEDIIDWLKHSVYEEVEHNAFNIIISPLSASTSPFLKAVVDHGFESSVRLLNIPIGISYKEDVRTKFSYITEEYKRLKALLGNPTINVYYVDTCIITGSTLQRGKQFLNMLLDDSDENSNINLFRGIILLANRSSYETISNIIPKYIEDGFFAYVHLKVPSYNTQNGTCPSCNLVNQYTLMHKRSSTPKIAMEYDRLRRKHKCKTVQEYDLWLEESILTQKSYTRWFLQWYYYQNNKYDVTLRDKKNNPDITHDILNTSTFIDVLGNEIPDINIGEFKSAIEAIEKHYTDNIELSTLTDDSLKKKIVLLIKKTIIDEKNFLRLICTHNVNERLENVMTTIPADDNSEVLAEAETRRRILALIQEKFKEIDNLSPAHPLTIQFKHWLKAEWLLSYIKVISRKQVAQYYHIRNAIYQILSELAVALITDANSTTKRKLEPDILFLYDFCNINSNNTYKNTIMPEMKIKVLLTIIRRLSAMHSLFVNNNINSINNFFEDCREQYNNTSGHFFDSDNIHLAYTKWIAFPNKPELLFSLSKLIKWSAMSTHDESRCFETEKLCNKENHWNTYALMFLENVQIIYNGIDRLVSNYVKKSYEFNEIEKYIREAYTNAQKDSADSLNPEYFEMNVHKDFFKFMNMRQHYHNHHENIIISKYTHMFLYFYELKKCMAMKSVTDNPYCYENICNHIRDILEKGHCKIICNDQNKNYILSTSNINEQYMYNDLTVSDIDTLIYQFNETNNDKGIIGKTFKQYKNKNYIVTIIDIPITNISSPHTYIMAYSQNRNADSSDNESFVSIAPDKILYEDLWNIRNVLSLRDKLQKVLNRDMILLKDMIHNYSYIKKLNEKPVVMHISDLHISKSRTDINKLRKNINNLNLKTKPDLLLITGDVIQGSYSPIELIQNYEAAMDVIKSLAINLWGIEVQGIDSIIKYVRSDWQKRILISTGNHDYASMNELEAQNKQRMTLSGSPTNMIGTTMTKHSYFINFLHQLLGIDIDDALQYNLNFITNYDKLGLSVININTSSGVNPCRTNKVLVDEKSINRMLQINKPLSTVVYMMHHTPMYEINYIDDMYYLKPQFHRIIEDRAKDHNIDISATTPPRFWMDLIEYIALESELLFYNQPYKTYEQLFKNILEDIKNTDKKSFEETSYDDFLFYLELPREERCVNDKCRKISYHIKEQKYASEIDCKQYALFARKHFVNANYRYFILGGHTHQAGKYSGTFVNALHNCFGIYEAGKFINESALVYSILTINSTQNHTYKFEGQDPILKPQSNKMIQEIFKNPPQQSDIPADDFNNNH